MPEDLGTASYEAETGAAAAVAMTSLWQTLLGFLQFLPAIAFVLYSRTDPGLIPRFALGAALAIPVVLAL